MILTDRCNSPCPSEAIALVLFYIGRPDYVSVWFSIWQIEQNVKADVAAEHINVICLYQISSASLRWLWKEETLKAGKKYGNGSPRGTWFQLTDYVRLLSQGCETHMVPELVIHG